MTFNLKPYSDAYKAGAAAFNAGESIRANPHPGDDRYRPYWERGFEQRRDQVHAARKTNATE